MDRSRWTSVATVGTVVLALGAALALPVLGQDPSQSTGAEKPGNGPPSEKPGRDPRSDRVPQSPVALTGQVRTRTTDDGDNEYTLTVGSNVYVLHVGPPWWWGEDHPLKPLVGDSITVTGEAAEGSTDVDVFTVGGKTIREPGKPPWAGGWKAVGEKHPGWAQWKADRLAAKGERGHGPPPWAGSQDEADPQP